MKYLLLACALLCSSVHAEDGPMTSDQILEIIVELGDNVLVDGNIVRFEFAEVPIVYIYDNNADRMRFMTPIIEVDQLAEGMLLRAMQANFSSVLDARYAVSNGSVWAAFLHPTSQLTGVMVLSAMQQVASAALTFGTEYSGGTITFGGGNDAPAEEEPAPEEHDT